MIIVMDTVLYINSIQRLFGPIISTKIIHQAMVKRKSIMELRVKENLTTECGKEKPYIFNQISLKRSDQFLILNIIKAQFTYLCKMARFLSKNGIMVKNCMKKNLCKTLEMYLRLT